jgi:hypothetical protein
MEGQQSISSDRPVSVRNSLRSWMFAEGSRKPFSPTQICSTPTRKASNSNPAARSHVALSTRKREPRQAGNGATVARKGVTGPFPILSPNPGAPTLESIGGRLRRFAWRGVQLSGSQTGRGQRSQDRAIVARRFRSAGLFSRRARFGNVQRDLGASFSGAPGSAPEAQRAFPPLPRWCRRCGPSHATPLFRGWRARKGWRRTLILLPRAAL